MSKALPLSGLERFMAVCQCNALPWTHEPAVLPALAAGSLVAGLALDPLLAAVYTRVDFMGAKEGFSLFRTHDPRGADLFQRNERWRRNQPAPFDALLIFGVPELVARDGTLVQMLREGRFDFLGVPQDTSLQEWIAEVSSFQTPR